MWNDKPYYSLDYYLKEKYGEKIYKIALDGGMTCPNRDGSLGYGGCIFCSERGSGDYASPRFISIHEQMEYGRTLFKGKNTGNKYIAYFQSFTNTYAPVSYLKDIFTEALTESDVVGISIGTRPDCLGEEVIKLLVLLKNQYPDKFIWVELGLQSIHEKTATFIRRGYPLSCYDDAVLRLKAHDIPVITHIILGLPHENMTHYLETVRHLNKLGIFGIKLQLLHVIKGTDLVSYYESNPDAFFLMDKEKYLKAVVSCLEILNPDITIHRVTGDGPRELTLAPLWSLNKRDVLNSLHKYMRTQQTYQGKYYYD